MSTRIAPMLAVADADAAIAFYQAAFGATVSWRLGEGHVVAGLEIDGAPFFLATESPEYGTRGPVVGRLHDRAHRAVRRRSGRRVPARRRRWRHGQGSGAGAHT